MQDKIIEGYLRNYIQDEDLSDLTETEAFERFMNYCVIARDHPDPFDIENVSIGGTGDLGIDGLAIKVNDHLVSSEEDIIYFKNQLRRLDAAFVFVQSKTSATFDGGDIGKFLFGVRSFFEQQPESFTNPDLRQASLLKNYIYSSSIDMDANPTLTLYYATLGKWNDDVYLNQVIDETVRVLQSSDLFSSVRFIPMDAQAVKDAYRELKRKIVKEIIFEKHTILPQIQGVDEAYLGVLPGREYLSLITGSDGRLLRSLFYDNVRDYQGNNPVNQEIAATLSDIALQDKFTVLNNGITIVAQSLLKTGSKFKLVDFQIVNGCQTSHVLHSAGDVGAGVQIPIKLIVTSDHEVTNMIIKATNRQTEVKVEAFESLKPFQRDLEEFYSSMTKEGRQRLWYERRSKQYDHLNISVHDIITLTSQVWSSIAMFFNEPHSTHRYYGELLSANRGKIFQIEHSPYPYYVSGYSLWLVDKLFYSRKLPFRYKKYRYQLLMLFRVLAEPTDLPYLNSKKAIDKYCDNLMKKLEDEEQATSLFKKAIGLLEECLKKIEVASESPMRLKAFTSALLDSTNRRIGEATPPVVRMRGRVVKFSDVKGYGFLKVDDPGQRDVFLHVTDLRQGGILTVRQGDAFEFTPCATKNGVHATDISIHKDM